MDALLQSVTNLSWFRAILYPCSPAQGPVTELGGDSNRLRHGSIRDGLRHKRLIT